MNEQQNYRIGAVSKLTGISPDTLRVWERRYQVVEPSRTEKGGRLYSREEVSRLIKIKALVDHGNSISTLVPLSDEQLHERLAEINGLDVADDRPERHHTCVIGEAFSIRMFYANKPDNIFLEDTFDSIESFIESETQCDSLIIEQSVIEQDNVKLIADPKLRELTKRVLVIYAFGQTKLVRQLTRMGVDVLKAPVSNDLVWKVLTSVTQTGRNSAIDSINVTNASLETIPDRVFTSEEMAACAGIQSKLQCECPHHMSQLIETMAAFEQYSASCENHTAADAALHGYLHVMTARARHVMETALQTLLEAEKIDISQHMSKHRNQVV